jgi:hypothetical protein
MNLKLLRKVQPKLAAMADITAAMSLEQIDTVVDTIHGAIARNYPDVTRDEIEEMVDLGNAGAIFQAIMGISGLRRGEAEAGSQPSGAISTDALQPPQAGPGA